MLAENLTEEAIEQQLNRFCSYFGPVQTACTDLVGMLPQAVRDFNRKLQQNNHRYFRSHALSSLGDQALSAWNWVSVKSLSLPILTLRMCPPSWLTSTCPLLNDVSGLPLFFKFCEAHPHYRDQDLRQPSLSADRAVPREHR